MICSGLLALRAFSQGYFSSATRTGRGSHSNACSGFSIGLWLGGELLRQLEANQILAELMLSVLQEMDSFQVAKYQKPQSLNWITSYFSFNLAEPLSLVDMARRAQLSPSRFSAVFKERLGVSPHQYLLHLRIAHAQELLAGAPFTITEIAAYCGLPMCITSPKHSAK